MIRPPVLLILLAVAGCGYTPQQLGITGPGTGQTAVFSHASEAEQDATIPEPGLAAGFGSRYAPSVGSGNEGSRFYGYN